MSSHTNASAGRVHLFDELRGLAVLLMVAYHGAFDLVAIYGVEIPIFYAPFLQLFLQPLFAGVFVMISGAVSCYSRNNFRRGLAALGCGLLFTLVTSFIMPAAPDLFGILHLIGCSILLYALFRPLLQKLSPTAGLALFGALFLLTYLVPAGKFGVPPLAFPLPGAWYATPFLFPLGLPGPTFASADYFPMLPWTFLFLAGTYLGAPAKQGRLPAFFYRSHLKILAVVGRHSLWIYLFHQPVLIALISVGFWIVTGSLFPAG